MANAFGARTVTKISPPVAARGANQLSLIRSVLIDSGQRDPFCEAIFEKIFACADVAVACDVDAKLNAQLRKLFVARR